MSSLAAAVVSDVATRAKPFDLRRQETIERARLRTLQPMLETIAHRMGGSLSAALRQPVRAELTGFDQMSWEDFAASVPDPSFVGSAALLPLEGRIVLHMPIPFTLLAIDYFLGGDGQNQPERPQLTDLERNLVSAVVDPLWQEVPQPFANFITLSPAMITTGTSALLVQVGRPGILCLVVRISLTIADSPTHQADLCLPVNAVNALIEGLERHQSNGGTTGLDRREARRRLLAVPLEMRLAYPPLGLRPAELLGLRVGDVIHIGQFEPNQPLDLTVGDVLYGTGLLVDHGKRLACTILSKKEPDDDQ